MPPTASASRGSLSAHDVRQALSRVLTSSQFEASARSRAFLQFVVERTLEGEAELISQEAIAAEALDRNDRFDPATDPIVRMQAGRVRQALKNYYLTDGCNDAVAITIPKGTYVPEFRWNKLPRREDPDEPQAPLAETEPAIAPIRWPTILVAPFHNLTGTPQNDYLAHGLAVDLATELNHYREVSVFLAPAQEDVRDSRGLCQFEVRGTILGGKNSLRLNVQLVNRATGELIWGQNFPLEQDRSTGTAPLDELTQQIAAVVAEEKGLVARYLLPGRSGARPQVSTAYHALLEYYHFDQHNNPDRFQSALKGLQSAVALDPNCGPCWSALARLYGELLGHQLQVPPFTFDEAISCARRGVMLQPGNQKSLIILAYVLLLADQVDEARSTVEAAYDLEPDSLFFLDAIGYLLTLCGDWDRGPALCRRAIAHNPFHRDAVHAALWLDALRRADWEEAFHQSREFESLFSFWAPLTRAVAMVQSQRSVGLEKELADLRELNPDFAENARELIKAYVKFQELQELILAALTKAGLRVG